MAQYGYLTHHGIKGQKWGVRRYQNSNGTLTKAGMARYGVGRVQKFGDNHIFELQDYSNEAPIYNNKSYAAGQAVTRQRLRLRKEMGKDLRNSYKNKEISKEYYKNSKKHLKSNVDNIVREYAGETALKSSKRNRGMAAAQMALGALVTVGATVGMIYSVTH